MPVLIASHLIYLTNSLVIKSLLHSAPPSNIFWPGARVLMSVAYLSLPDEKFGAIICTPSSGELLRLLSLFCVIVILIALLGAYLNLNASTLTVNTLLPRMGGFNSTLLITNREE